MRNLFKYVEQVSSSLHILVRRRGKNFNGNCWPEVAKRPTIIGAGYFQIRIMCTHLRDVPPHCETSMGGEAPADRGGFFRRVMAAIGRVSGVRGRRRRGVLKARPSGGFQARMTYDENLIRHRHYVIAGGSLRFRCVRRSEVFR